MNPFQSVGVSCSIPSKYVIPLPPRNVKDFCEKRYVLAAHVNWVRELISSKKIPATFPLHEKLDEDEVHAFLGQGKLGAFEENWMFLLVSVLKYRKKVDTFVDLDDRGGVTTRHQNKGSGNMTWPEIVDFIGESNFSFIWEQPQITLLGRRVNADNDANNRTRLLKNEELQIQPSVKLEASLFVDKLLKRIYPNLEGVGDGSTEDNSGSTGSTVSTAVSNLLQPLTAVVIPTSIQNLREEEDNSECVFLFHQHPGFNLFDAVTFSPQKLASTSRQMFVIYQILHFLRDYQTLGIPLTNLTLKDFGVDESLYVTAIPWVGEVLEKSRLTEATENESQIIGDPEVLKMLNWIVNKVRGWDVGLKPDDIEVNANFVESVIRHWCEGLITNYDYLMFLNFLSGRFCNGNPNFHPVFPWVSDLSSPTGGWRDFSKSKFRLNKGDRQLDIMYEEVTSENAVPHHVTDMLSEITYYVYKARRTPRTVLCKFVRRNWVPAEYPASISRMQGWTPDECIPEFFDDPTIFKSIHEDLPDLKVPKWCNTPEEFIKQHRRMLESDFVSAKLHHWIDLTFGYKLSGTGAVKSKNVYLPLVDAHQHLESHGVVQLFQTAHPPRRNPLRDCRNIVSYKDLKRLRENEDFEQSQESNPVDAKSRLWKNINLPKHYDPMGLFNDFEVTINFFKTHFSYLKDPGVMLTGLKDRDEIPSAVKLLGCLLAEIVLPLKFRHVSCTDDIDVKFDTYKHIVRAFMPLVPVFCRRAIQCIFDRDCLEFSIPINVSIEFLLLGDRVGPIPFPSYFADLHKMLRTLRNYDKVLSTASPDDNTYRLRLQELKVQSFSRDFLQLLDSLDNDGVDLVLPFIVEMFENPESRVLAAWSMFCPLAKALGKKRAVEHMLQPILNIYKSDYHSGKHLKLFHKTFLLQLSSCFGLRVFLDNFSTVLVEAIGGWKISGDHHQCVLRVHLKPELAEEDGYKSQGEMSPSEISTEEKREGKIVSTKITSAKAGFSRSGSEAGETSSVHTYEPEMFVMEPEVSDSESDSGFVAPLTTTTTTTPLEPNVTTPTAVFINEPSKIHRNRSPQQSISRSRRSSSMTRSGSVSSNGSKSVVAISDVCFESIISMAHRLGPVLAAKYFTKNLLKVLTLCYMDHLDLVESQKAGLACDGDTHASKVLDCLIGISDLYGDVFVERQYIPYCCEIIKSAKRKLSSLTESALIGVTTLLDRIFQYIPDAMLLAQLQEPVIKDILCPLADIFCSPSTEFPSGSVPRALLASKCVSIMICIRKKIGPDLCQLHLKPIIFTICKTFQSVYSGSKSEKIPADMPSAFDPLLGAQIFAVFCDALTGSEYESLIRDLYLSHGLSENAAQLKEEDGGGSSESSQQKRRIDQQSSFGSRSFGNRIQIQEAEPICEETKQQIMTRKDVTRHLKGNWLVYWEHEVGRSDSKFNFKQIKLQTFSGHTGSVRCIYVLDNENSFLTASKDKTVKLWSLRNQGDENVVTSCQWTYSYHKKAVLSVVFNEASHLAASTDGFVHIWDPFVGKLIRVLDKGASAKSGCVCSLRQIQNSSHFLGAGTDSTVHVIDFRTQHAYELKIGISQSSGLVRCLAASDNGQTVAVGHSSGMLSTLDLRNGTLLGSWKGHDGEVLQILPHANRQLISSSFDQNICVWSLDDNRQLFNMRGVTEPVHSMCTFNSELISCTTSNRIGIHCGIDPNADFSSTRLRSDTFKGVVTSMQLLPLNQFLLLGSEAGNIVLLC